jgi:hypothetical protein
LGGPTAGVVAHPSSDYILVSGTHGKIVLITADLAEARISTVAEYRRVPQSTAEYRRVPPASPRRAPAPNSSARLHRPCRRAMSGAGSRAGLTPATSAPGWGQLRRSFRVGVVKVRGEIANAGAANHPSVDPSGALPPPPPLGRGCADRRRRHMHRERDEAAASGTAGP